MKSKWKLKTLIITIVALNSLVAQEENEWAASPTLNLSGFVDAFYMYDNNRPETDYRQTFLYNHNRHNEFNLNLGLIHLNADHKKYRANLGLQAGTYGNDNYAAESGIMKNVFEANAGVSLNKENSLWLDVGIFGSHLGFESAISMDNYTLTRSLVAENSPYFLSGAKVTYNPDDHWQLSFTLCNGWQRIQRIEGNSLLSFGTQVNYTFSESASVNWSTFIGTDDPDIDRRMLYFNNFYTVLQLFANFGVIAGFDVGARQVSNQSSEYDVWIGPVIIGQFNLAEQWKSAFRFEYYQDKAGVIIPTGTPNGYDVTGISVNLDYLPSSKVALRVEGRWLNSKDEIFTKGDSFSANNFVLGTSLAIKLGE